MRLGVSVFRHAGGARHLAIVGADSHLARRENVCECDDPEVVEMGGVGMRPHTEAPSAVASLLKAFLDEEDRMKESRRRIAVLPGDGIGADVTSAALPVFGVLGTNRELLPGSIGWECWRDFGNPIPDATWELIETSDATLVRAVTSKPARSRSGASSRRGLRRSQIRLAGHPAQTASGAVDQLQAGAGSPGRAF
jgi:hypothetical protein